MDHNIEIEIRENCLFAVAKGVRTENSISEIAKEIFDKCASNNIVKAFVDLRQLTGRLNISESLQVINKLFPEIGIFRKLEKVAVLETNERNERSVFFEQAAQARGYNIRMFDDQDNAADWLSECKQPA